MILALPNPESFVTAGLPDAPVGPELESHSSAYRERHANYPSRFV